MGVSLHYRGTLEAERLPGLLAELEDIAASMNWRAHRIRRDEKNPELEGIILNPGNNTESLPFLFDRQGRLRCLADLLCRTSEPVGEWSCIVSVKTQFGGIGTHQWIIGLLRYLQSRYLPDLHVTDEGGYWETSDPALLAERRDFLAARITELAEGLSEMELSESDDPEALADAIERFFQHRMKKNG